MDRVEQREFALAILEREGIATRKEHLGGSGGGLCVVRGERVYFLDLDADEVTSLERVVAALRAVPDLDQVHLPPVIRERLDEGRSPSEP